MKPPCSELRILDLSTGPAGGMATMVLADFGADVIKIERPGGDPFRRLAAAPMWLRGKRSVVLDLRTDEGREQLGRLAEGADAVVASFRPGRAAALGADPETLRARNPALVYTSITAFGPRGPYAGYPAYEGVVAAKSGRMQHFAGLTSREGPSYAGVQTATHAAAQSAITGTLAALLVRERTGRGQLVETSLLQGLLPYDVNGLVRAQLRERYPEAMASDVSGNYGLQPPLYYQPVMTQDGHWIQLANLVDHLFHSYIAAIGLGDIYEDERFLGAPRWLDEEPREELRNRILERMRELPLEEWMRRFHEAGNVAAEPFGDAQRGLEHPDLLANGELLDIEHPRLGTVRQLGPLCRLSETPARIGGSAPEVGEHTAQVLGEPPREVAKSREAASAATMPHAPATLGTSAPPLDGVTVLEFATIIAAPLGVALLADLGARVIKVEPIGGEMIRGIGVGLGGYVGASKTTAGKRSICVDMKSEAGRGIIDRLLEGADVLVHNYRPGVPERLGIGYEQARARSPQIVYVPVNGYGPDGPSAQRPSAHPIPGAACGGAWQQAGAAMPPQRAETLDELREAARWLFRANEANPDPSTSMVVASTVLLALYARARTGRGQLAGISMLGANAYANADDFVRYQGKPPRRRPDALVHGLHALYRLYPARRGWVFLAAPTQREWERLCPVLDGAVLGEELAEDERFSSVGSRLEHDEALVEVLGARFAERDAEEWERALIAVDVGCVRADEQAAGEFFANDAHPALNGFTPQAEHAIWGPYRRWGATVTFSETPASLGPGVLAGEQTDAILDELGYDGAAIAKLHDARVVSSEPIVNPRAVTARS